MQRSRRAPILFVFALALTGPAHVAGEGAPIHKPSAVSRVVHVFDFEEQGVNNEPVPMRWVRGQDNPPARPRPGFPPWNRAAFDFSVAHGGSASVKLPVDGGSASLRLAPGVIPVIPGGEYEVSAYIRTQGLTHARARLVARFFDERLMPIPASERATDPIESPGAWREAHVRIPGVFPDAAWLTIDLELLQPAQLSSETRTAGAGVSPVGINADAIAEDLGAAAWFDDVTVRIVPVVTLKTNNPAGVIVGDDPPIIHARIDDVVGDPLVATLRLVSIDGETVDSLVVDPARPGSEIVWTPATPAFGWWRAQIMVHTGDRVIARATRNLVWAPPAQNELERKHFVTVLGDGASAPTEPLLELITATHAGAVEAPLWRAGQSLADIHTDADALTTLLEELLSRGVSVGFSLDRLPDAMARDARLDPSRVLDALADPAGAWAPWLDEALSRFGQRVHRWRLGDVADRRVDDPARRAALYAAAAAPLRDRVLTPLPMLTWPAEIAPPAALAGAETFLTWPSQTPPESILDVAATSAGFGRSTLLIEPDRTGGRRATAIDLARRVIRAWQAGPARVALAQPWSWRATRDGSAATEPVERASGPFASMPLADPDPTLAVWRTLVDQLGGRRVVGSLPLSDGAVALVLDGPAGGAIVAWNESAEPDDARLDAYLADGAIRVVDLFGNVRSVEPTAGTHTIELGPEPVFLQGVDAALARFRAGFRVEPGHVESTAERHRLELVLRNPWPIEINGEVRIVEPADWSFTPRVLGFTLAPGEETRLPVDASFGLSALAGRRRLRALVRLEATERYPTITMDAPIELGLSGVDLFPSYQIRRTNGRADLIVTLLVVNTGKDATTLTAYAQAPGKKRQQAPISNLAPRAAAVRRFLYRGAGDELVGADIQVGAIEAVGLGRLTRRLHVE